MMSISHVADKKGKPDVDENVSHRSHDHTPVASIINATECFPFYLLNDQAIQRLCSGVFYCKSILIAGSMVTLRFHLLAVLVVSWLFMSTHPVPHHHQPNNNSVSHNRSYLFADVDIR
jgi:hypothetical protein